MKRNSLYEDLVKDDRNAAHANWFYTKERRPSAAQAERINTAIAEKAARAAAAPTHGPEDFMADVGADAEEEGGNGCSMM